MFVNIWIMPVTTNHKLNKMSLNNANSIEMTYWEKEVYELKSQGKIFIVYKHYFLS